MISDKLLGSPLAGWDMPNATYDSVAKVLTSQEGLPTGLFFSPDGTKMFVVGIGNDTVFRYDLSTAWDISTASYASNSQSVNAQDGNPMGLFFSPDGLKMYVVGDTNNTVYQYTLTIPWNLATASYASLSFSVGSQDTGPNGVAFSADGTKMYIAGFANVRVYQYSLSSAWDVSTASYGGINKNVGPEITSALTDVFFSPDGTRMFVIGNNSDSTARYDLTIPWDISTAAYHSTSRSVFPEDNDPQAIFFNPEGTKMYVLGNQNNSVYQYTVP